MITSRAPGPGADGVAGLLDELPLFAGLARARRELLARDHRFALCAAGEVLVHQGAFATELCVILSGSVGVYRTGADGGTQALEHLGPGSWLGELGLLASAPSPVACVAETSCALLVLDEALFGALYRERDAAFRAALDESYRVRALVAYLAALEGSPLGPAADELACAELRVCAAGERIAAEGRPLSAFPIVMSGGVEYVRGAGQDERCLGAAEPVCALGLGVLEGAGRLFWPCTAIALVRTDVLALPLEPRAHLLERLTPGALARGAWRT